MMQRFGNSATLRKFLPHPNRLIAIGSNFKITYPVSSSLPTFSLQRIRIQQYATNTKNTEKVNVEYESNTVVEVNSFEHFVSVLQDSARQLIILDCYADWCAPCRELTPLLTKIVSEFEGKVKLVKLNVDQQQEVAQQFQIEVLPTVFAIAGGKTVVSKFTGAVPEANLRKWVTDILGALAAQGGMGTESKGEAGNTVDYDTMTPQQILAEMNKLFAEKKFDECSIAVSKLLGNKDAKDLHPKAYACLIMTLLSQGQVEAAKTYKAEIEEHYPLSVQTEPDVKRAFGLLHLSENYNDIVGDTVDAASAIKDLENKLKENELDFQVRYNLATLYFLVGEQQRAVDEAIKIVRKSPKWNNGAAKDLCLKFFDILGPQDPISQNGRKKLSAALF